MYFLIFHDFSQPNCQNIWIQKNDLTFFLKRQNIVLILVRTKITKMFQFKFLSKILYVEINVVLEMMKTVIASRIFGKMQCQADFEPRIRC